VEESLAVLAADDLPGYFVPLALEVSEYHIAGSVVDKVAVDEADALGA